MYYAQRLRLFILMAFAPCLCHAQDFSEADIPAVKEIQTTILNMVLKAVTNFDDMREAEVLRKTDFVMYKATATPAMYAQQYYLTYVTSNKKSYYMSYYTTPHDIILATTAFLTMNAYAGEKWQTKAEAGDDKDITTTDLYCAGVKLGTLRLNKKENSVALSIGFFGDPGTATSDTKKPGISANTSLQKTFKLLNFHKVFSTRPASNLDFSFESHTTLPGPKNGTININTASATLTVQAEGDNPLIYKIITVQPETTDQYDNRKLQVLCTDAAGLSCTATIERKYAYTTDNEMVMTITYASGAAKGYICTYLQNLFEN